MSIIRALGFGVWLLMLGPEAGGDALEPTPVPVAGLAWRTFHSEEGRFRVLLPDVPSTRQESYQGWLGTSRDARVAVDLGGAELSVEHHDLPRLATLLIPSGSILRRASRGLLDDVDGREFDSRDTSWQGFPARTLRYQIPAQPGWREDALLVLARSRLYVVIAARGREDELGLPVSDFFDSSEIWLPE